MDGTSPAKGNVYQAFECRVRKTATVTRVNRIEDSAAVLVLLLSGWRYPWPSLTAHGREVTHGRRHRSDRIWARREVRHRAAGAALGRPGVAARRRAHRRH